MSDDWTATFQPMTDPMHLIDATLNAWNAAARPWDPDALAALYTDDALLFGGRPDHAVGALAIRAYFESYRGVILAASLVLDTQALRWVGKDACIAQGFGDFTFDRAGNSRTRSRLRTTWVIARDGPNWRIRLHHFSPPPSVPPLGE
jgi:uncharacterized protein (TIGR02246 family)